MSVGKLLVIIEICDREVQFCVQTFWLFNGISVNKVTRSRAKNSRSTKPTPASSCPLFTTYQVMVNSASFYPNRSFPPRLKCRCKSIKIFEYIYICFECNIVNVDCAVSNEAESIRIYFTTISLVLHHWFNIVSEILRGSCKTGTSLATK